MIVNVAEIAFQLLGLVERAPAGGAFTNAKIGYEFVTAHRGYANESETFVIETEGRKFAVTVEELLSRT